VSWPSLIRLPSRRFASHIVPVRRATIYVAGAALLAGVTAAILTATREHEELRAVGHPAVWAFVLVIGWSFIGSGIVAAARGLGSRFGALMIGAGFAWFAAALSASGIPVLFTIGTLLASLWIAIFVHALMAFPGGRLESRAARVVVAAFYFPAVVLQLGWLMFTDTTTLDGCHGCPANLVLVSDRPHLANAILDIEQPIVGFVALAGAVAILAHRWWAGTPPARRSLGPVLASGGACLVILALTIFVEPLSYRGGQVIGWAGAIAFSAVPFAFLLGLLRQRLDRSAVAQLVIELGGPAAQANLQAALSRALRDPSVQIAYWLPDAERYVDPGGRPMDPPAEHDSRRATTTVDHHGERVAILVHDPSLLEDPELVHGVCAAAGLSLSNQRLQAQLRARLLELQESRTRIVEVGDAERRRLERDLHDGAQQRLVSLALDLSSVGARVRGDPETAALVTAIRAELARSLEELRELAQGIHPAALTDHGLPVALETVTTRCAIPCSLTVAIEERLAMQVEVAIYYLVSEALTNVAKHAGASRASVSIARANGSVRVEVTDDGVGGARVGTGSGLTGLADRIAALGGSLEVRSPSSGGTMVRAEIPCG